MTNSGPPPMYNFAKNTSLTSTSLENYSSSVLQPASIPKLYPTLEPKLENSEPLQSQQKSPDKVLQEINKKEKSKKRVKKAKETPKEEPPKLEQKLDIKPLEQNITKRCLRCYQYYTEASLARDENKTPCRYHPGNYNRAYSSPLLSGAAITYWSCCKSSNRNEPGCRHTQHKEDPQMTKVQQNFSRNLEEQAKIGLLVDAPFTLGAEQNKDKEPEKEKENEKIKKPEKISNVIRHYVTEADTLIGLSFRYGVTAQSIRKLNRMPTDDVQAFSRLYIPKKGFDVSVIDIHSDDEDTVPPPMNDAERALFEKRMLQRLRGQTGMSLEEAKYYMSLYGFSFMEALREYNEDMEFERTHPFVPPTKIENSPKKKSKKSEKR